MNEMQELQKMSPEELQELIEIYRAKKGGTMRAGQLHKPVLVNPYEEQLLGSLPNVSGQVDPMTGLRSFYQDPGETGKDVDSGYTTKEQLVVDAAVKAATAPSRDKDDRKTTITYSATDLDGGKHSSADSLTAKNQVISTTRTNTSLGTQVTAGTLLPTTEWDTWWEAQTKDDQASWGNFTESQVKSLFDKKVAELAKKTTDQYGKVWGTEAEKTTSDGLINHGKENFSRWVKESGNIFTDDTFESATNRGVWDTAADEVLYFDRVSDADKKTLFLETMGQMVEGAKPEINLFVDNLSGILQGLSQEELTSLQLGDLVSRASTSRRRMGKAEIRREEKEMRDALNRGEITVQDFENYRAKIRENPYKEESILYLSENAKRGLAEKALDLAVREARFTLTPEEVAQWSTEAPTVDETKVAWGVAPVIATATNFQEWWDSKGGPGTPEAPGTYPDETSARTAWEAAQVGQDVFAPVVAMADNFEDWWKGRGGEGGQYPDRATAEAQWEKEQVTAVGKTTISEIKAPTAAVIATADNFQEWWNAKGGAAGAYKDEASAKAAWEAAQVGELTKTTITKPADISAPTVERVAAISRTKIPDFGFIQGTDVVLYDTSEIDALRSKEGDFYRILKETIEGKRDSQAQQMLRAETERMMRLMLGTVAGADADPRKLRGIQNLWSDQQQNMIRESTQLRSKEKQDAQARMLQLFEISGTREAKLALADMEARRLTAIEQGKLDQARLIKDAEFRLQTVITQATLEMTARQEKLHAELKIAINEGNNEAARKIAQQRADLDIALGNAELEQAATLEKFNADLLTAIENGQLDQARKIFNAEVALRQQMKNADSELAVQLKKLETQKDLAIANGNFELATVLGNLQGSLLIATTNPELAIQSRAMDNALAMAAYEGQMQMAGIDVKIDENALDRELKTYLSDSAISADLEKAALQIDASLTIAKMQDTIARLEIDVKNDYNDILKLAEKNKSNTQLYSSLLNAVATGISSYAALNTGGSDIRMKKNVSGADPEIERFLDALNAYQYEYKDPKAPYADEGMFVGIMAQDAERGGPMGESFVKDTPDGKVLNTAHGMAAILAAQANLHERTKKLEGGV